jgi:hypothetical protein
MKTITSDELPDYIEEPCPWCGEWSLYLEFDEWDVETGEPTDTGTHVHCKNEDEKGYPDHYQLPYVYWMPLEIRAHYWAAANIRIADKDDRKEVTDWNAGKPLPGRMR